MLKHILAITVALSLLGCNSTGVESSAYESVQSGQKVETLDELHALPVAQGEDVEITLTQGSQHLIALGIDSPVAVYKIADYNKVVNLDVKSFYDSKFFAPSVLVIDSNGKRLADIPNSEFEYKAPAFVLTHRQEVSKNILTADTKADVLYVIVYTTKNDAKGISSIEVEKKHSQFAEIVKVPHAMTGRVSLEYETLDKSDSVILSDSDSGLEIKTIEHNTKKVKTLFSSLRKAIQEKDTKRALELVDEIEAF